MSQYIDRTGQRVGPWVVLADAGRTKRGKVLWSCRHDGGSITHFKSEAISKLAKSYGVPKPVRQ